MRNIEYIIVVDGKPLRTSDGKITRYENYENALQIMIMCYGEKAKDVGIWASNLDDEYLVLAIKKKGEKGE